MAEIDAATESPPIPPTDNGDRLYREPLRLVQRLHPLQPPITRGRKGGQCPSNIGPITKRKMSENQLETLRKAREAKAAKAAKARDVKVSPQPIEEVQHVDEVSPPITKQETP
jgi:hypothetical protein